MVIGILFNISFLELGMGEIIMKYIWISKWRTSLMARSLGQVIHVNDLSERALNHVHCSKIQTGTLNRITSSCNSSEQEKLDYLLEWTCLVILFVTKCLAVSWYPVSGTRFEYAIENKAQFPVKCHIIYANWVLKAVMTTRREVGSSRIACRILYLNRVAWHIRLHVCWIRSSLPDIKFMESNM